MGVNSGTDILHLKITVGVSKIVQFIQCRSHLSQHFTWETFSIILADKSPLPYCQLITTVLHKNLTTIFCDFEAQKFWQAIMNFYLSLQIFQWSFNLSKVMSVFLKKYKDFQLTQKTLHTLVLTVTLDNNFYTWVKNSAHEDTGLTWRSFFIS